jgi:hypothetical protein
MLVTYGRLSLLLNHDDLARRLSRYEVPWPNKQSFVVLSMSTQDGSRCELTAVSLVEYCTSAPPLCTTDQDLDHIRPFIDRSPRDFKKIPELGVTILVLPRPVSGLSRDIYKTNSLLHHCNYITTATTTTTTTITITELHQ